VVKLSLLLSEFSKQHHFELPTADDRGIYSLSIDDMEIKCFERLGKGYLYSNLTTLPEQANDLPVVLKDLMHHALTRIKSQSCALGLSEDGNLVLFERFDMDTINLGAFFEILENYSNALEEYRYFIAAKNVKRYSPDTMIISP